MSKELQVPNRDEPEEVHYCTMPNSLPFTSLPPVLLRDGLVVSCRTQLCTRRCHANLLDTVLIFRRLFDQWTAKAMHFGCGHAFESSASSWVFGEEEIKSTSSSSVLFPAFVENQVLKETKVPFRTYNRSSTGDNDGELEVAPEPEQTPAMEGSVKDGRRSGSRSKGKEHKKKAQQKQNSSRKDTQDICLKDRVSCSSCAAWVAQQLNHFCALYVEKRHRIPEIRLLAVEKLEPRRLDSEMVGRWHNRGMAGRVISIPNERTTFISKGNGATALVTIVDKGTFMLHGERNRFIYWLDYRAGLLRAKPLDGEWNRVLEYERVVPGNPGSSDC